MSTAKDIASDTLHSATEQTSGVLHSAAEKASDALHSTTEKASGTLHSATETTNGTLHSATEKTNGTFHSATEKTNGTFHSATEKTNGTLHSATEKVSRTLHSATEKASGTLHSATEKAKSAKESVRQSTSVQRYIVSPASYSKERLVSGLTVASRYVKSEMSLTRLLLSVATVFVVLGYNVVMSKFKVHPPTLRSALLMGTWVAMVSILATLVVPPAFEYVRVRALGPRTVNEKNRNDSGSASAPVSEDRPSSPPTTGPFDVYRKQARRTGTGGGCRHPRHGANATVDAVAEAIAAVNKATDKED
ncbi:hypothetical protein BG015_005945 [Linnemannia schmuckeri]|uniref:Uncharacterized protein n=1 Tax=Linnemannia schmuckeri TaxID=64567 RepID=A0A9P5VBT8_9FUNG|nr:hypothetical protein BG015_005945 [Linnemannia schmuckeri]